jgi:ketopantoate reductase
MLNFLLETHRIFKMCGYVGLTSFHHRRVFHPKMLADTAKLKSYLTSMRLDHDAGRPMEVGAIFGNPLRVARSAGAVLPRIETLYRQLKFLDSRPLKI